MASIPSDATFAACISVTSVTFAAVTSVTSAAGVIAMSHGCGNRHPINTAPTQKTVVLNRRHRNRFFYINRNQSRHAGLMHGDAHQLFGHFHGNFVVGDVNKLHRARHFFH
jgi:hypothetical protein